MRRPYTPQIRRGDGDDSTFYVDDPEPARDAAGEIVKQELTVDQKIRTMLVSSLRATPSLVTPRRPTRAVPAHLKQFLS